MRAGGPQQDPESWTFFVVLLNGGGLDCGLLLLKGSQRPMVQPTAATQPLVTIMSRRAALTSGSPCFLNAAIERGGFSPKLAEIVIRFAPSSPPVCVRVIVLLLAVEICNDRPRTARLGAAVLGVAEAVA